MNAEHPCHNCSDCCMYVATQIDTPTSKQDYQNIRWYLCHENVIVFKASDDKKWYIQFNTPCKMLTEDGLCNIYKDRPDICSDYATETCTRHGGTEEYDLLFTDLEQWERWWTKVK